METLFLSALRIGVLLASFVAVVAVLISSRRKSCPVCATTMEFIWAGRDLDCAWEDHRPTIIDGGRFFSVYRCYNCGHVLQTTDRAKRAFTLVELLVVISILAILASM